MTQEQKIFLENKLTRKEENEQLGADLNEGSYYTFDYQDENESAKTYYVFYHCVNGSRNYYAGATDGTYKAILIDEESLQNTSTNYIKIKFKPIEAAAYEIDLSLDDFAQNPLPEEIKPRRVLRDITNLQRAKSRSQMEQKTRQNMDLGSASKSIRDSENYSTPMKKREAQNDVTNRGRRMTFPTPEKENEPNAPSNGFFIENTQNHIAHDELNLGSLYTLINFDEMEKCIAAIKTPEKDSLLKDITNQVIESNRASGINSEIDSTSVKNPKNLNKRRKTFPMPKQDKLFQEISNEQRKERMASLMLYSTPKKNSDKNITKTVHEKLTQAQENADQIISVELRSTKYRFNNESHIYPNIAQLIKKLDRANNNEIDSIIELEIFIQEQGDKLHMVLTNEDWPIFTALYYGNIYFFALDDDVNAISMEIPYKLSEQTYNNEDIIAIKKRIQSRKEDVVWMVQAAHEEMAS